MRRDDNKNEILHLPLVLNQLNPSIFVFVLHEVLQSSLKFNIVQHAPREWLRGRQTTVEIQQLLPGDETLWTHNGGSCAPLVIFPSVEAKDYEIICGSPPTTFRVLGPVKLRAICNPLNWKGRKHTSLNLATWANSEPADSAKTPSNWFSIMPFLRWIIFGTVSPGTPASIFEKP